MSELSGDGKYSITDSEKAGLKDFYGGYADEAQTAEQIAKIYKASGYVIDTHTAVASYVCDEYKNQFSYSGLGSCRFAIDLFDKEYLVCGNLNYSFVHFLYGKSHCKRYFFENGKSNSGRRRMI